MSFQQFRFQLFSWLLLTVRKDVVFVLQCLRVFFSNPRLPSELQEVSLQLLSPVFDCRMTTKYADRHFRRQPDGTLIEGEQINLYWNSHNFQKQRQQSKWKKNMKKQKTKFQLPQKLKNFGKSVGTQLLLLPLNQLTEVATAEPTFRDWCLLPKWKTLHCNCRRPF